jgi:transcriptional regulator with XRE-family HTH domain
MTQPKYALADMLKLPRLRRVRQSKLLSMRELAEKAGVAATTIYSIETGHAAQFETIRKLCAALEVELQDLTGEQEERE